MIGVDLIDVRNGTPLWKKVYDGQKSDSLGIRERIAKDLASRLRSSALWADFIRLNLGSTTMYSFVELAAWLPTQGFEVVWSRRFTDIGLFLLRRNI